MSQGCPLEGHVYEIKYLCAERSYLVGGSQRAPVIQCDCQLPHANGGRHDAAILCNLHVYHKVEFSYWI
eukprot:1130156-Amorphochlora_amoeboformis.AAC.1